MQVGDLVKHFLTEQVGIVLELTDEARAAGPTGAHVLWTTQGLSLFAPGGKEWCGVTSLTVLTSS